MSLTVECYNKQEEDSKRNLSNRFIEAFQPEIFQEVGFPGRIKNEVELYRYIDSMHDGRLRHYSEIYGPTIEEFEMIKNMCKKIGSIIFSM